MENMAWEYNYTSGLYQRPVGDALLSIDPRLDRTSEDEGWLPCKGVAISLVYNEAEWTCHEHLEYDRTTKKYQVGTRKWRAAEEGLEFREYQDIAIHILQHEKTLKEKGIPPRAQQNIANFFEEVKKTIN